MIPSCLNLRQTKSDQIECDLINSTSRSCNLSNTFRDVKTLLATALKAFEDQQTQDTAYLSSCTRPPDKAVNHWYNSVIISVATTCRDGAGNPPFAARDSDRTQRERMEDESLESHTRSRTSLSVWAAGVEHLQGCRSKRFASITGGPALSSFQSVGFGDASPTRPTTIRP